MFNDRFLGFSATYNGRELGGIVAIAVFLFPWCFGVVSLIKALLGL